MATSKPLRVGFVPEHFSTPLYFAKLHFGLAAELIPFPSGTGHMITSLRLGEIDVGIGLTEGWVAGLGKENVESDGGYTIVGTYVETPLCMSKLFIQYTPLVMGLNWSGCDTWLMRITKNRLGNIHRVRPQNQHRYRS